MQFRAAGATAPANISSGTTPPRVATGGTSDAMFYSLRSDEVGVKKGNMNSQPKAGVSSHSMSTEWSNDSPEAAVLTLRKSCSWSAPLQGSLSSFLSASLHARE